MALTGIEIFKLLAKTNCKECGFPTCLAFAMALASGKAELDKCPYVSEEVREKLAAASAPPIRPIKIGMKDGVKTIGGETVMFRHEKTFFNPTLIAGEVNTALADAEVDKKLDQFMKLQYERVGLMLRPELIAVHDKNGDAGKFAALVKKVMDKTDAGLILGSDKPEVVKAGAEVAKERKPLIGVATAANADAMGALAKELGLPLIASAKGYDDLAALVTKLTGMGLKDLVIDSRLPGPQGSLAGSDRHPPGRARAQVPALRLPHDHHAVCDDRRSHDGKALRRGLYRQIRRHRSA